ncbi:MAG: hypothetical protein DWI57_09295 [Chloroflexi bacterium]|nr:MAG: hypothetical protein DWI57_09295 [Chloroflexota bacterium]
MNPAQEFDWTRSTGIVLLVTVFVFLIGAFSAAYFRAMPPSDPRQQLTLIANDPIGWPTQAIIFPVAFLATALIFGSIALRLPAGWPRWLALAATLLFVAGFLLWLPISSDRLRLGREAAEMLRTFDPAAPPQVFGNGWVFWPHTITVLTAIGLMGAALALGGLLPTLGWWVAGLGLLGLVAGPLILRDWPPFASYLFLLVMAIGLLRR